MICFASSGLFISNDAGVHQGRARPEFMGIPAFNVTIILMHFGLIQVTDYSILNNTFQKQSGHWVRLRAGPYIRDLPISKCN